MKSYCIRWQHQGREYCLDLGKRTYVMGILNITPDSFSDGGIFFDFEKALARGQQMVEDGADILDIGGESTRPFSDTVSAAEEIRRVVPVIEKLAPRVSVPISLDTTKAEVARRGLEAGASIINDISALRADPQLGSLAAQYGVPLILMHMKGSPKDMQLAPHYDDLIGEIKTFLADAVQRALQQGAERSKLIIDPGIGFGKTRDHNLTLIKHLNAFSDLDLPVLLGASRKAFIRNLLKGENEKDISPLLPIVETGTQAGVAAGVLSGAHIVRVHNVANTRATVRIIDAVRNA
ncbi:MAG: dihydropteroate synthase [Desulfococcaceae bacterium]|jgi:dihydropteroate synthase|nr:dihydropteroate synthase [Desulfococcaceae bacterium]